MVSTPHELEAPSGVGSTGGQPWKAKVKGALPWLIHGVRGLRWAKSQLSFPIVGAALELYAKGRVLGGPFKGMRFPGSGIGGAFYQHLLGSYEWSLIPTIEQVIARSPMTIVDAGAAYGYYAIGLAIRCPGSRVIAYEMDQSRANLLGKYARLNDVAARLDLRGICRPESLAGDVKNAPDAFILMDVEGAENILLPADRVDAFKGTELLIETHDHFVPEVTARLQERFAQTHIQTVLHHEEGWPDVALYHRMWHFPVLRPILRRMINEYRGVEMAWLHLRPVSTLQDDRDKNCLIQHVARG